MRASFFVPGYESVPRRPSGFVLEPFADEGGQAFAKIFGIKE
jgi:hypothetical protein